MAEETSNPTDSKIPGGLILTFIGAMVLLTPLVTELDKQGLVLDLVCGGVLFIVGVGSLYFGLKKPKQNPEGSQTS